MVDLKSGFYKTFANLPLGVRDGIVLVIDGQPTTWNVIKLEVDTDSKTSKKALKLLDELRLIKK
ncbi:hypothetical protein KKC08_01315 [Patescibacteria group bacterium]|nr:hypothetical protein [Patescibacteria group bacterium]MCG2702556.1 hypothetical protein [Candidatus Parcubacteria bacterium]MBU4265094.1 hypothetical protein [Patescibacteria group bacterium]MBU4389666.1 hypothetical protein [Patescibacteria group bacterium]MBU4396792.1 hypothetical protein [Patescibacteria group bacterium]